MNNQPLILGHRGSSAVAPENTLAAFKRSIIDGADGIEFDVRLAADEVPVVIHDANLSRTALLDRPVSEMTSSALGRIDVGKWFPSSSRAQTEDQMVPTLAEVFALFTKRTGLLYVELKGEPVGTLLPARVVELIEKQFSSDRVVVESFDLEAIAEIKRLNADIRTAALFERRPTKPILRGKTILQRARQVQAEEIALHHTLASAKLVARARESGFDVVVWTVDQARWIDKARTCGIKALITNDPAKLLARRKDLSV